MGVVTSEHWRQGEQAAAKISRNASLDLRPEFDTASELFSRICWQAIYSRDSRFAGRFVAGTKSTGIYCRNICAVPFGNPGNIVLFACATEAEIAGFRPCKRCRPQVAAGTPAWNGTSAVVSRALRLIHQGALNGGSIEDLAVRVGLGTRQLRRLFIEHVGVAPIKLVTSHRIQLAKHLISESNSPLTEIALSSGFKSIREFNHAILKSTGASPRKLRRAIGSSLSVTSLNKLRLCLAYKRPFDWAGVIEFLQMRAVPGVELVQQDCYQRTIEVRGVAGLLTVRPNQALARLDVELESSSYKGVLEIAGRVRRIFDLNADPVQISNHLRRDPTLQSSVNCRPGLRVPGAWDGFEAAVLAAAGESLASPGDGESIRPLVSIFGARIENKVPGLNYLFPRPEVLAVADLSKAGLSNECAERVRRLALFALDNQFGSAYFPTLEERISRMRAHTGIDQITAHYIAMRAFGEPDAFPADGWKIGRRIKAATGDSPSLIQAMAIADHWRPWRAYAAMHLTYTKSTVRIS